MTGPQGRKACVHLFASLASLARSQPQQSHLIGGFSSLILCLWSVLAVPVRCPARP